MALRYISVLALILLTHTVKAQQFIGLNTQLHTSIQQMPYNPAWVNASETGTEIGFFGVSALAGTNAYRVRKDWTLGLFEEPGSLGDKYIRDIRKKDKHLWANYDLLGPSIAFKFKDKHHIGVYTRTRQIIRSGNLSRTAVRLLGDYTTELDNYTVDIKRGGFITHSFAEVGFTYGQYLVNDEFVKFNWGVSVKYLMGLVAGSMYTPAMKYTPKNKDSIAKVEGDMTVAYSYNVNSYIDKSVSNDFGYNERGGRGSLGFDIGAQYEYHPEGTPNAETPYLFSIAASITDIGAITYIADTGSGTYKVNTANKDVDNYNNKGYQYLGDYFNYLVKDTLVTRQEALKKFRVGLPTAFRANLDWNIKDMFSLGVNILLNLRGINGTVYKPGYVSYINFTPTYGNRTWAVSLPLTYLGYQTMNMGAILRYKGFYIGSTSLLTVLVSEKLSNADIYMGVGIKFRKNFYHP
jgi:hypothetical protein